MKKEMTLTADTNAVKTTRTLTETAVRAVRIVLIPVAGYYSDVLGEKVSLRQTLLLLNAQAAFVMTVFPSDCSLILRGLCLCWLVKALRQCRRSGLRTSC